MWVKSVGSIKWYQKQLEPTLWFLYWQEKRPSSAWCLRSRLMHLQLCVSCSGMFQNVSYNFATFRVLELVRSVFIKPHQLSWLLWQRSNEDWIEEPGELLEVGSLKWYILIRAVHINIAVYTFVQKWHYVLRVIKLLLSLIGAHHFKVFWCNTFFE